MRSPLTVSCQFLHAQLAERGAEPAVVARHAVDLDRDLDVALRLRAEPPRPPARRVVDLDGQVERVVAGRERDVLGRRRHRRAVRPGHGRVQARAERHRVRVPARVERDVEQEPPAGLGRLAAQRRAAT